MEPEGRGVRLAAYIRRNMRYLKSERIAITCGLGLQKSSHFLAVSE